MKRTALKLSIPAPCTENWDNMTPNERGRHCASCDKTVIDFSLYTDKQLVEFFNKTANKVCGRLSNWQLERQVVYAEPVKRSFFSKLFFGTALASGIASTTVAQSKTIPPATADSIASKTTDTTKPEAPIPVKEKKHHSPKVYNITVTTTVGCICSVPAVSEGIQPDYWVKKFLNNLNNGLGWITPRLTFAKYKEDIKQ